jgi:hypothetical protein
MPHDIYIVPWTDIAHTAPVLRDVDIKYGPTEFNGAFMKEDIYRKEGSDEVDKAWEALGVNCKSLLDKKKVFNMLTSADRAGVISKEDGLRSGLDESFVQRADKYGGGFLVNVEGMHHLHCLVIINTALTIGMELTLHAEPRASSAVLQLRPIQGDGTSRVEERRAHPPPARQ